MCAYAHGDVHCGWCDEKMGSGHEINGGLHKWVASDPTGENVYILALKNSKLKSELATMNDLRTNFGVTCIPTIKSEMTLSGEKLEHALAREKHAWNAFTTRRNGWFSMMQNAYSDDKSVQLITEENTGQTLTTYASNVASQCDTLSTCLHMYTFLHEVFKMMDANVAYFHGDLHKNNITWKLQENTQTGQTGIRFCLIDWGEAQRIDSSTTELKAIQKAYRLSNLQANKSDRKPPEFTMFAMLILFVFKQEESTHLDTTMKKIDKLDIVEVQTHIESTAYTNSCEMMTNFSRFYRNYISNADMQALWKRVKMTFVQMLENESDTTIKEELLAVCDAFEYVNVHARDRIFSKFFLKFLLQAFEQQYRDEHGMLKHLWKPDSSSYTPALALMQRMQAWALSCNVGGFWYDNVLSKQEHHEAAWDVWEKILLPMRVCEKGWFVKVQLEIEKQRNKLTVGIDYARHHAVAGQSCASFPGERECVCMHPTYAAGDACYRALHAGAAEACAYQLGVDECSWCDCDDGQYGPETHTLINGTYKVVADVPDRTTVCMLVNDDDTIEQELKLMRKLRNELHISCVPLVKDSSSKLTLDQVQKWLKEIQKRRGVDRRIITALQTSISGKQDVLKIKKDIEKIESELAEDTQMLENGQEDEESKDDIKHRIQYKTKHIELLKERATDYDTWYIEEEFVGRDLAATLRTGATPTKLDYIKTCSNLLALLQDVAKLIKDDCKIFNCDINLKNLTCQSQCNPETQKNWLRFYVIDWGGGQELQPDTKIPQFLLFFFKKAELRNDRRQEIPDEFVACFMCFYLCITDKDQLPKAHLQNFAKSECSLRDVWKRVQKHNMFERFGRIDTEQERMWKSIQRFCARVSSTLWIDTLETLRRKSDDDRAEKFMYFMLDYFRYTFGIDTREQALVPMMQRVECWAYGHALSLFWKDFMGAHLESPLRTLHEIVIEQLETLISNRNSFDTLNRVVHTITAALQ